jgi:serine/threonine protein phosphatase PrpC
MGGANAGEVASALVIESLQRAMLERALGKVADDWEAILKNSVEHANGEVWRAAREPGRRGMGATLTAICILGGEAIIAEVGDSRGYLIRGHRIRQVTRDQSFVQVLVDSGALKPEEAAKNPMKNVVLQAMGQTQQVSVAMGRLDLRRGDRLLLCSDGLSNKVEDDDICRLAGTLPLPTATAKLIELANERGGEDNITVVLAEVDGDSLAEHQSVETVTQTLRVISEYPGPAHVKDDDDSSEADSEYETPLRPGGSAKVTPVVQPPKSDAAKVAADATGADSAVRSDPPRPILGTALYQSLVAVAAGVLLALLVIWLFLSR